MGRSTGIAPGPGFGLASEPIAICAESAPKSLLGPTPATGMPPPPPPPYPPPPPHAARPSKADNITEVARSLGVRRLCLLSVTNSDDVYARRVQVNSTSSRTLPVGQESARFRCGFAPGRGVLLQKRKRRSAPGPQVGLPCIRIGFRLDRFGPLAEAHGDPGPFGPPASVPADLLQEVVELGARPGRASTAAG